ncbi:MAG: prepilin-type N-terminal cleavage/methylation domain-containing protein [Oscillospiraceae bacterium]|nr:prepilin-type N-terminal cleavage/methylation domain-containing protein [Oscillospiraceae bacterium]
MPKIIKRLLRWRNNSGFTLVEVIVASALLGVLLLGVIGFMQPVLQSVAVKEQNARAVMLAESIDSYVASSIKYSYYIQTFTNVTSADVKPVAAAGNKPPILGMQYNGTEYPAHNGEGLQMMLDCLNNSLATDLYEIRCIGVRWVDDGKSGKKKLILTNEYVDQTNCALDETKYKPVFEDCFYDGLYPIIKFENYSNQYQLPDASGNLVDQVDPADVDMAKGLKVTTEIYLDPECYNSEETKRSSKQLNFSGTQYVDFINIRSNLINDGTYKMMPNIEAATYSAALAHSTSTTYLDDNGDTYYYPNTFIYYIARKIKLPTGP